MNNNGHSQNGSPSRIVCFPSDVSIGNVALYGPKANLFPFHLYFGEDDPTKQDSIDDVKEIEDVRGDLVVHNGTTISLGIYYDSKLPLLAKLAPDSIDAIYFANSVLVEEIPDIDHLTRLRYLGLSKHCGTDRSLNHVSNIRSLTHLLLNRCERVTDWGLSHLSELKSLTHLSCRGTPIHGTGLGHLADAASLQYLDLSEATSLTNEGLFQLSQITSLKYLSLGYTELTDDGVRNLSNLISLKILILPSDGISENAIEELQTSLPACKITTDDSMVPWKSE